MKGQGVFVYLKTMTRKLYHLHLKATGADHYYGSLQALVLDPDHTAATLGVGIDTLYRVDWAKGYSNEKIVIKKGTLKTAVSVKKSLAE